jgi:hypothetical protein
MTSVVKRRKFDLSTRPLRGDVLEEQPPVQLKGVGKLHASQHYAVQLFLKKD